VQRLISGLGRILPDRVKRIIVGPQGEPTWLANTIHSALNRLPSEPYPILECGGPLRGYRMRIDWKRYRSFVYGTWEPDVVAAIEGSVKPGWTAVDVGAHIGYYTLLLSRLVGGEGRVFSFEALPQNFAVLSENIALNRLAQTKPVNRAVVDRSGPLQMSIPEQGSMPEGASVLSYRGKSLVEVDAVSLDDFCANLPGQVDFLKLDVEGAEEMVLRGARALISKSHPVMEIEIHHFDGNLAGNPVPSLLKEWGYQFRWIDITDKWTSHLLATWGGTPSEGSAA